MNTKLNIFIHSRLREYLIYIQYEVFEGINNRKKKQIENYTSLNEIQTVFI